MVPGRLLTHAFREAVDAAAPAAETPPPLEFASDAAGRYALYRLQKGEALYSAVVVRFTGRVHAEDVNAKAAEIAARSGIDDVRSIPVGFAIKIPIADLAPEFRPPDDPARIEEEKARLEAAQFANTVRTADLSGVTVVLDAGHGGPRHRRHRRRDARRRPTSTTLRAGSNGGSATERRPASCPPSGATPPAPPPGRTGWPSSAARAC